MGEQESLTHYGVDLAHGRLSELIKLADAAKPFYEWVQAQSRQVCGGTQSLTDNLLRMSSAELVRLIKGCYEADVNTDLPSLFDGAGRKYSHRKACFCFFGWLLRDAPSQRLGPILARAAKQASTADRATFEAEALAKLTIAYRTTLGTFDWTAVREVLIDRLEGSRRAMRGRRLEAVVRTAVAVALQRFYESHGSYGRFASVEIPDSGRRVGNEEFDVVVHLMNRNGEAAEEILVPVKTRETEGGGHSHLFTRDIGAAIGTARSTQGCYWIAAFIIAMNWSQREQEFVQQMCDFAVALSANPAEVETIDERTQASLDAFIAGVLSGRLKRKLRYDGA